MRLFWSKSTTKRMAITMLTRLIITVTLATLATIAGCGGAGKSDINVPENWDETYTYSPCETGKAETARMRALAAMLKALDVNRWEIESAKLATHSINAKACQLPLLVECESAVFSVDENGVVTARPTTKQFRSDLREKMYEWLAILEEPFAEWRCAEEEILRKKAGEYDLIF